jgi:hypothetical protein
MRSRWNDPTPGLFLLASNSCVVQSTVFPHYVSRHYVCTIVDYTVLSGSTRALVLCNACCALFWCAMFRMCSLCLHCLGVATKTFKVGKHQEPLPLACSTSALTNRTLVQGMMKYMLPGTNVEAEPSTSTNGFGSAPFVSLSLCCSAAACAALLRCSNAMLLALWVRDLA